MRNIQNKYIKDPITQIEEPAILFRISQRYRDGLSENELYQITRGEWVIGKRREHAKYAFAVYQGIIVEVYQIKKWFPFSGKTPSKGQRWYFDGSVAEHLQHYKGGSVKHYFKQGGVNPVTYINC